MTLSAREIKDIRALGQKKFRQERGLFTVEGTKLVEEALQSDFEVTAVYRSQEIGEAAMQRITQQSSPTPALAVVKMKQQDATLPSSGLVLALDSLRNPGNVGTIIRLAEWFGIDTVLLSPDCVELYNPKTVQATMGSIFRVRCIYTPLTEALESIRASGMPVYGTFLDGESIYDAQLPKDAVIVMGSEADGITPPIARLCNGRISIPSFAAGGRGPESLNVAIAAAITCSEFRRTR